MNSEYYTEDVLELFNKARMNQVIEKNKSSLPIDIKEMLNEVVEVQPSYVEAHPRL